MCVCVCVCVKISLTCRVSVCRCSSRPPPSRCPWAWAPPCPWACSTSPRSTSSSATRSRTSRRGRCRPPPWPRSCPRIPTTNRTGPRSYRTDYSENQLERDPSMLVLAELPPPPPPTHPPTHPPNHHQLSPDRKTSKDILGCCVFSHLFRKLRCILLFLLLTGDLAL